MNNEMKKGYIIFNADGSKPTATLAALDDPKHVQVVCDGGHSSILKLFGSIANAMVNEAKIPKEILHNTIDLAAGSGKLWAALFNLADKASYAVIESGKEINSPEEFSEFMEEVDLEELFRSDD